MKIFLTLIACFLLTGLGENCMEKSKLVDSEIELTHVEPTHIPRGPGGDWPKSACVELLVSIGSDGKPNNISIEKSSQNYALDLAILKAVGIYRFRVPDKNVEMFERRIFVRYGGKGPGVSVLSSCSQ